MIPKEVYEKYHLADIAEYETESTFYETFLIQTDFIANKILEVLSTPPTQEILNGFAKKFEQDYAPQKQIERFCKLIQTIKIK